MTDRTHLDDLTSEQLDALYDELDRLRARIDRAGIDGPETAPPATRWQIEARIKDRYGTLARDLTDRDRAVDLYRRRRREHPDSGVRLVRKVTLSLVDDPDTDPSP
ncbi:hypothetical protein AQJ30_15740 [Streptomyces longwoodensis]|uniref:Uncharacterized protein n=1 Tax=Streptomyces longwoodensis TaxID=68231 RepID=A0A124HR84_9ACTN|nr:hypothetical protein [Streptomyces longwoodensis]KUN37734.1 hypothetical protein AQJ30_15740 [Streptomyces longwoodensis]